MSVLLTNLLYNCESVNIQQTIINLFFLFLTFFQVVRQKELKLIPSTYDNIWFDYLENARYVNLLRLEINHYHIQGCIMRRILPRFFIGRRCAHYKQEQCVSLFPRPGNQMTTMFFCLLLSTCKVKYFLNCLDTIPQNII